MENSIQSINQFDIRIKFVNKPQLGLETVKELADQFIKRFGYSEVKHFYHEFDPIGITYVSILSESHIAIHTWPEHNFLHIDLISCKKITSIEIERFLKGFFLKNLFDVKINQSEFKL